MVDKYNQESYTAVDCEIQLEWIFLQHVPKNRGHALEELERNLRETFLPNLFLEDKNPPYICRSSKHVTGK